MSGNNGVSRISVSEKKSLEKLLETKKTNVLFAINNEVFNRNEESVRQLINDELGITSTSDELERLIGQTEKEIEGLCQDDYRIIDEEFESKNNLEIEEIDQKKQALKEKFDREIRELNNRSIGARSGVKDQKDVRYKQLEREKHPELFDKVAELKLKHAETEKKELEAQEIYRRRKSEYQKHSARFINIINERHLDSLTKLTLTEDRAVAAAQVNWLPSSVQIAEMAGQPGGLEKLISMLSNPSKLLGMSSPPEPERAPKEQKQEVTCVSVEIDGKLVEVTPEAR